MQWIDTLAEWDGWFPVVLTGSDPGRNERHGLLKNLVIRGLKLHPQLVEIEHGPDRPPLLAKPVGKGLFLSLASRNGLAAYACAQNPVGVDVESIDPEAEVPWNVLHPLEKAQIEALQGRPRAMLFARIWTLKEAYLKALALGLARDTRSFAIVVEGDHVRIEDPQIKAKGVEAHSTWRTTKDSQWAAVSILCLKL